MAPSSWEAKSFLVLPSALEKLSNSSRLVPTSTSTTFFVVAVVCFFRAFLSDLLCILSCTLSFFLFIFFRHTSLYYFPFLFRHNLISISTILFSFFSSWSNALYRSKTIFCKLCFLRNTVYFFLGTFDDTSVVQS